MSPRYGFDRLELAGGLTAHHRLFVVVMEVASVPLFFLVKNHDMLDRTRSRS